MRNFIQESLEKGMNKYKGFNPNNPIFNPIYMEIIKDN